MAEAFSRRSFSLKAFGAVLGLSGVRAASAALPMAGRQPASAVAGNDPAKPAVLLHCPSWTPAQVEDFRRFWHAMTTGPALRDLQRISVVGAEGPAVLPFEKKALVLE